MRNEEISYEQVFKYCEQRNLVLIDYDLLIRLYNNKKAIPVEWIKNYASHKASKDLIDCYWHFWEDDVLKMVAEWEKENDKQ